MISAYPRDLPGGGSAKEFAVAFDEGRDVRILIVPALFDEANRMRRFTVEIMRRLDRAGIDCFLPDLPGCNESVTPLESLEPEDWHDAMAAAARHFRASHVLAVRGGALLTPPRLPGWHYAPVKGATILRQMIRGRIIAAREAGNHETQDGLMETGLRDGLELAGYRLSAEFLRQFQTLLPRESRDIVEIEQGTIGGSGLWLRAEPDEDREQADALAAILAIGAKG